MKKVGVIGLGNIASVYGGSYTHVGGILESSKVLLTAVADISEAAHAKFDEQWGSKFPDTKRYRDYGEMFAAEDLDIVAVCTRGPHHFRAMMDVIKAGPKAIFLEKPPSCSLQEMDEMNAAAHAAGIPITISYSRHWGPHLLRMAELIKEDLIGKVTSVVGHCGHAMLSFASHQTDMICQFAGYDPVAVYARGTIPEKRIPAGYEQEPSLRSMIIEFKSGVIGTQTDVGGELGPFSCTIQGSKGRACVAYYKPPLVWDGKGEVIDMSRHGIPNMDTSPFKVAYEQIADHLNGGPLPDCTGDTAVAVNEIGFGGIESIATGTRIELPNKARMRRVYADM